jgi:excisionase family DNA binding protein
VKGDNVFTTGQVAHLFHVSNRTVIRWGDSGLLACYRLPGSRDRRFTRAAVEEFAARHGIPADWRALEKQAA